MATATDDYTAYVVESWPRLLRTAYALSGDKYRAWDCTVTAECEPLTEPTDEEIRLISWDL